MNKSTTLSRPAAATEAMQGFENYYHAWAHAQVNAPSGYKIRRVSVDPLTGIENWEWYYIKTEIS